MIIPQSDDDVDVIISLGDTSERHIFPRIPGVHLWLSGMVALDVVDGLDVPVANNLQVLEPILRSWGI
jgi:hypothetical protein